MDTDTEWGEDKAKGEGEWNELAEGSTSPLVTAP